MCWLDGNRINDWGLQPDSMWTVTVAEAGVEMLPQSAFATEQYYLKSVSV